MCGICGVISRRKNDVEWRETRVSRMNALMVRRGPDDEGKWSDPRVTLGFRRLAIIDLSSNGHQPMGTPDGRYQLVFNGEVYNFMEIREELTRLGVVFLSRCDTEVVLHALAVWGKSALSKFNGMFALAFYDTFRKRLLLARDPVGIKPLYYAASRDFFIFGSQFDQILTFRSEIQFTLCVVGVANYLRLGYVPAPHSIYREIRMLEAGCLVEIDEDLNVTHGRYWEFPKNSRADLRGEEAVDWVNRTIGACVRRQLVSDVPVGCFLSGGIDSPLVAAKIREHTRAPIKAFTLRVNGDDCDESVWAEDYAKSIGLEQVFVDCDASNLLDLVMRSIEACQEPFADYSILPTMLVSQAAASSVKVMLSGDGGDELFWGYYGRFASVLGRCEEFKASYPVRSLKRSLRRMSGRRNPGQHLVQRTIGDWVRAKHSRIFDEDIEQLFVDPLPFVDGCGLFEYDGFDQDETAQWLRWNEFVGHLSMVLLKVDRASMFSSLEVRVPLLDMELVNLAGRIHWSDCLDMRSGLGKKPLRACLGKYVEKQCMQKRGFSIPMSRWLKGPLRPIVEDVLLSRGELLGLKLDRAACRRFVEAHDLMGNDRGWSIWLLLSLALWEDRYCKG